MRGVSARQILQLHDPVRIPILRIPKFHRSSYRPPLPTTCATPTAAQVDYPSTVHVLPSWLHPEGDREGWKVWCNSSNAAPERIVGKHYTLFGALAPPSFLRLCSRNVWMKPLKTMQALDSKPMLSPSKKTCFTSENHPNQQTTRTELFLNHQWHRRTLQ